jgi:hypothetical protein
VPVSVLALLEPLELHAASTQLTTTPTSNGRTRNGRTRNGLRTE